MAKGGKNRLGLHRNVSEVLKGVPIPQGVGNWRPPNKSAPGRTDRSFGSGKSSVSSVFKGVDDSADSGEVPRNAGSPQDCADACGIDAFDGRRLMHGDVVKRLDPTDDGSLAPASGVAHYRDPLIESAPPTGGWRILKRLFGRRRCRDG